MESKPIVVKCIDDTGIPLDFLIALSNEGFEPIVKGKEYELEGIAIKFGTGSLIAILSDYPSHKFVWKTERFRTLDNVPLYKLIQGTFIGDVYSKINN